MIKLERGTFLEFTRFSKNNIRQRGELGAIHKKSPGDIASIIFRNWEQGNRLTEDTFDVLEDNVFPSRYDSYVRLDDLPVHVLISCILGDTVVADASIDDVIAKYRMRTDLRPRYRLEAFVEELSELGFLKQSYQAPKEDWKKIPGVAWEEALELNKEDLK